MSLVTCVPRASHYDDEDGQPRRLRMKLCPFCQAEYPDDVNHCEADGERLIRLATARDELVGAVLDGRYALDERIGQGGMGTVYRGRQLPMGRPVALKVLQNELASDKRAVKRFFNEARVVSKLRHPNTVDLYDFGQSESGHLFIAMEYLRGLSLDRLVERRRLTLPEIVEIVDQVCQSLEEAHEIGVIHRDLKPDNVFIDRVGGRNMVKVLDFGIAKVPGRERLTRTGMVFGTPSFMSPEQAQGHPLDGRSDIYTLGILCYWLLSGHLPFTATSPMQVALQHVTRRPKPIRTISLYQPLPLHLASLVMDMLEKEVDDRPASMGAVRDRLRRVAREIPGVVVTEEAALVTRPSPVVELEGAELDELVTQPPSRIAGPARSPTADELDSEEIRTDQQPLLAQTSEDHAAVPTARRPIIAVFASAVVITVVALGILWLGDHASPNGAEVLAAPVIVTPSVSVIGPGSGLGTAQSVKQPSRPDASRRAEALGQATGRLAGAIVAARHLVSRLDRSVQPARRRSERVARERAEPAPTELVEAESVDEPGPAVEAIEPRLTPVGPAIPLLDEAPDGARNLMPPVLFDPDAPDAGP